MYKVELSDRRKITSRFHQLLAIVAAGPLPASPASGGGGFRATETFCYVSNGGFQEVLPPLAVGLRGPILRQEREVICRRLSVRARPFGARQLQAAHTMMQRADEMPVNRAGDVAIFIEQLAHLLRIHHQRVHLGDGPGRTGVHVGREQGRAAGDIPRSQRFEGREHLAADAQLLRHLARNDEIDLFGGRALFMQHGAGQEGLLPADGHELLQLLFR